MNYKLIAKRLRAMAEEIDGEKHFTHLALIGLLSALLSKSIQKLRSANGEEELISALNEAMKCLMKEVEYFPSIEDDEDDQSDIYEKNFDNSSTVESLCDEIKDTFKDL